MRNVEPSLGEFLEYSCLSFPPTPHLHVVMLDLWSPGPCVFCALQVATTNISLSPPYLPSHFSAIVPFTKYPPSSNSGLCCRIIFLSTMKMCQSDWFNKKLTHQSLGRIFREERMLGSGRWRCQGCRASRRVQDGDEMIKPRIRNYMNRNGLVYVIRAS